MTADPRRSRSGPNIPNAQRNTEQILLRLPPLIARRLRTYAATYGMTLGEAVADLLDGCGVVWGVEDDA